MLLLVACSNIVSCGVGLAVFSSFEINLPSDRVDCFTLIVFLLSCPTSIPKVL